MSFSPRSGQRIHPILYFFILFSISTFFPWPPQSPLFQIGTFRGCLEGCGSGIVRSLSSESSAEGGDREEPQCSLTRMRLPLKVAKNPSGEDINALKQHIENLLSPSTPFFFNTLYDPYREGADFVRGYPFSLREGAPTAVSRGLWLNIPEYDAPTQLVKPRERNTRYVDAVLTIPNQKMSKYPVRLMHVPLVMSENCKEQPAPSYCQLK